MPIYTQKDLDNGQAFRDAARQKMKDRLESAHAKQLRLLDNQASTLGEEELSNRRHQLDQHLEELLRVNDQRYGSRAPVRFEVKEVEDCEDNALYDVDLTNGDETIVYMQASSPLYALMAPVMKNEKDLTYALKLFLGSIGYAEHMDCKADPSRQEMWGDVRNDISSRVYKMLDILREQLNNEEVEA